MIGITSTLPQEKYITYMVAILLLCTRRDLRTTNASLLLLHCKHKNCSEDYEFDNQL